MRDGLLERGGGLLRGLDLLFGGGDLREGLRELGVAGGLVLGGGGDGFLLGGERGFQVNAGVARVQPGAAEEGEGGDGEEEEEEGGVAAELVERGGEGFEEGEHGVPFREKNRGA